MNDLFYAVAEYICDDIVRRAPYLAGALHSLTFISEPGRAIAGTDGTCVYWDPEELCSDFSKNESLPRCRLLHMLAHILLGHTGSAHDADSAQSLAFDIVAFRFVQSIDPDAIPPKTAVNFAALEKFLAPVADTAQIAEVIRKTFSPESIGHYAAYLQADDHTKWQNDPFETRVTGHSGTFGDLRGLGYDNEGTGKNGNSKHLDITLTQTDCSAFAQALERYTEPGEIPETDHDTFDIPLYLYSSDTIGASILEDSEFREGRKLRSFAIAIDTSGSCVRGLTRQFLEATRDIMINEHLFFSRFHLCILQCDDRIRDEAIIESALEFNRYIEDLRVYGGGGTDFRPVFDRIDALTANGVLPGLRGILYFSDGKGIFPGAKYDYDVTFAFPKGSDLIDVPSWVNRVSFHVSES